MSLNDDEKLSHDYHLSEMALRRERQWKVFSWCTTVMITLTTGTLLAYRNLNLGATESYVIAAMHVLLAVFSFDQMAHDRKVALAHWQPVHELHKGVPSLHEFSDYNAKLTRRLRSHVFLLILTVFVIAVTLLLGAGVLQVKGP